MPESDMTNLKIEELAKDPRFNAEPRQLDVAAAHYLSHAYELTLASHTPERIYPEPLATPTAGEEAGLVAVANGLMRAQSAQDRGAYLTRTAVLLAAHAQEAFLNDFEEDCLQDGLGSRAVRNKLKGQSLKQRLVDVPVAYLARQVIDGRLLSDARELVGLRNSLAHPTGKNVLRDAERGVRTAAAAKSVIAAAGVGVALAEARGTQADGCVTSILGVEDELRTWAERVDRHIPLPPMPFDRTLRFGGR